MSRTTPLWTNKWLQKVRKEGEEKKSKDKRCSGEEWNRETLGKNKNQTHIHTLLKKVKLLLIPLKSSVWHMGCWPLRSPDGHWINRPFCHRTSGSCRFPVQWDHSLFKWIPPAPRQGCYPSFQCKHTMHHIVSLAKVRTTSSKPVPFLFALPVVTKAT